MKAIVLALSVLLAGCTQPPQKEAAACPELPQPLGNTIAAQRAYTLVVVQMYAACAAGKAP